MKSLEDRFNSKYSIVESTGCWVWNAHISKEGYGEIKAPTRFGNKKFKAHRVSYVLNKGEIPDGLVIDHLCRNRACVNPDHLRVVTSVENILCGEGKGAKYARRTHCENGHEFTPANTITRTNGARRCRICKNQREKERKGQVRLKMKEEVGVRYGGLLEAARQMNGLNVVLQRLGRKHGSS